MAKKTSAQGPSKIDAVRQALAKLGAKAKTEAVQEYVKTEFGIDIKASYVQNLKSILKNEGKAKKKPKATPTPMHADNDTAAETSPRRTTAASVALEEIRAVKDLARRIGAENLKSLVDLVAM